MLRAEQVIDHLELSKVVKVARQSEPTKTTSRLLFYLTSPLLKYKLIMENVAYAYTFPTSSNFSTIITLHKDRIAVIMYFPCPGSFEFPSFNRDSTSGVGGIREPGK